MAQKLLLKFSIISSSPNPICTRFKRETRRNDSNVQFWPEQLVTLIWVNINTLTLSSFVCEGAILSEWPLCFYRSNPMSTNIFFRLQTISIWARKMILCHFFHNEYSMNWAHCMNLMHDFLSLDSNCWTFHSAFVNSVKTIFTKMQLDHIQFNNFSASNIWAELLLSINIVLRISIKNYGFFILDFIVIMIFYVTLSVARSWAHSSFIQLCSIYFLL